MPAPRTKIPDEMPVRYVIPVGYAAFDDALCEDPDVWPAMRLAFHIVRVNRTLGPCNQSLETLADELTVGRRTITRWIKALENAGIMHTVTVRDEKGHIAGAIRHVFPSRNERDAFLRHHTDESLSAKNGTQDHEKTLSAKNGTVLSVYESLLRKASLAPAPSATTEATPEQRESVDVASGDPEPKPKRKRRSKKTGDDTPTHPDFRTLQTMLVERAFRGNANQYGRAGVLAKWLTGVDWKGSEGTFAAPVPAVTPIELRLFLNQWTAPDFPLAVPSLDRHLTPWLQKRRTTIAATQAEQNVDKNQHDPAGQQLLEILGWTQ